MNHTQPVTTNRFSRTMSESTPKITTEEGKVASALQDYGVRFRWNSVEFRRPGTKNGHPLSYWPDFIVHRELVGRESKYKSLILQVEGKGSSSKGDQDMVEFFDSLGYLSIPIPNGLANDAHFRVVLAKLLAWACGTDRPEVLTL